MSTRTQPAMVVPNPAPPAWVAGEFEAVFAAHYARLAARLRVLAGDRAEDIAQEAFARLYRQPPPDRAQLGAWLHRVASRAAIDLLRAQQRRAKYEIAAARQAPSAANPDAEQAALAAERQACVRACLAALAPRQAQLVWLRHAGGSYREIAAAMGVQVTSVGALLARAEAAFARAWQRQALRRGCPAGTAPKAKEGGSHALPQ